MVVSTRSPRSVCAAVAVAAALGPTAAAAQDNVDLQRAREQIEQVRLDQALLSLESALARGGNQPAQMAEIYRLLGEAAAGTGDGERARDAFAHLLAIDPGSELDEMISPKIRDAFRAAQSAAPGGGWLALHHEVITEPSLGVTLRRDADPLELVVAAEVVYRAGDTRRSVRGEGQVTIEIALADSAVDDAVLYALDRRGNRVRAIELGSLRATEPAPSPPPVGPVAVDAPEPPELPVYRRWWPWAIGSGALAGAGVGLSFVRASARSDLDDILANEGDHFFREARAAEDRVDRYTTLVVTAGVLAAGAAAVGAVMLLTAPSRTTRATVAPVATDRSAGVSVEVRF